MLNYFIKNHLNGKDQDHYLCSCGNDEIKKHVRTYSYSSISCSKCGATCISNNDHVFLGKQDIKAIIVDMTSDKDCPYLLEFKFGIVNTTLETDFINEKMKLDTSEDCIVSYNKIIFDGKNKKEDMISYYDIKNNKEITKEEFLEVIYKDFNKYDCHNSSNRYMIERNTGLEIPYFNNASHMKPEITKLIMQLDKLTEYCVEKEILIKSGINPYTLTGAIEIDEDKTNPSAQLNLSPFMVKYLKQHGEQHHRALQFIQENLKEQAINYLDTFGKLEGGLSLYNVRKISTLIVSANLSIKKLYRYLYEDAPMQQGLYEPNETLNLLYDAYDLATKLELPFDKNPKALVRYHDILAREFNLVKDERKNELFAKAMTTYKNMELIEEEKIEEPEIKLDENGEEVVITKASKNKQLYAMILPKDAQDLIREGKIMRHCVASYVDRVIREECLIFFLRKADNIDTPFATIEVDPDTNSIRQVKCRANAKLKDMKAEKFINKWCKKNNIKWNGCW